MTVEPEVEPWSPPPVDPHDRHESTIDLMASGHRIYQRLDVPKGQVVDFCLSHQAYVEDVDAWLDVVRVDCCHGEVHAHHLDREGRQLTRSVIRPIGHVGDVQAGLEEAEALIYDRWEQHARRWDRG